MFELLVKMADGSLDYYLYSQDDNINHVMAKWGKLGCVVLRVLDAQIELPRF